jgi:GTP-binding protein YchF
LRLVKNAHEGEGLGNQFLGHIREVDAIVQVVRKFSNGNVSHVAGKIDPESDKETVNLELIFADLDTIKKRREKLVKLTHGQDKEAAKTLVIVDKIKKALEEGKMANKVELTEEEEVLIRDLNLLTLKPMLYVLNVDEDKIFQESDYIPISAKIEAELSELEKKEAKIYIEELGLKESGLDKLIAASYKLLDLITFFTTQNNILQAWTVTKNAKAPQAAGRIHGDFEKNFIKADVINWEKLTEVGSESEAHDKGLLKTQGKDYIVQDGDVIHFKTGA